MSKDRTKFNPVFEQLFLYVGENTSVDPNQPNGFRVKHKGRTKDSCCHIMLKQDNKGNIGEPKVTIEDDDTDGTCHCMICDRTFPTPDISLDNLHKLKEAASIINGALLLLPWSNISKTDAQLAVETRNMLERFIIMYESGVQDISTAQQVSTDLSMKSHVSRL